MNILIVEDDLLTATSLKEDLETAGNIVTGIARSFAEAMRSFRTHRPDFVILDISLGEESNQDGIELGNWLGQEEIPFIFLSGHSIPPAGVENSASYGYLTKPYVRQQLLVQLKLIFGRFLERQKAKQPGDGHESVYLRVNGKLVCIPFNELLFVEAERRKVKVYTNTTGSNPYQIGTNLGEVSHYFVHPDLISLKPSVIINKRHIRSVRDDSVEIGNSGRLLKLSANARKTLIDALYIVRTRSKNTKVNSEN